MIKSFNNLLHLYQKTSTSRYSSKYLILIEELKTHSNNDKYLAVVLGFINCLLSQPEDIKDRLKLRFEFKCNISQIH
jgi:hypothetical protein